MIIVWVLGVMFLLLFGILLINEEHGAVIGGVLVLSGITLLLQFWSFSMVDGDWYLVDDSKTINSTDNYLRLHGGEMTLYNKFGGEWRVSGKNFKKTTNQIVAVDPYGNSDTLKYSMKLFDLKLAAPGDTSLFKRCPSGFGSKLDDIALKSRSF